MDATIHAPLRANPYFSGARISAIPMPEFVALAYDSGKAPDGLRAVLLATLRSKRVDQDEWAIIKRHSHIR